MDNINYKHDDHRYEEAIKTFYKDKLQRILKLEKQQTDFTVPFHNYMGPGTKLTHNLIDDLLPTDYMDAISLDHDFEYLMAENKQDVLDADQRFSERATGPEGTVASLALSFKNKLPFGFVDENSLQKLTDDEIQILSDLYTYRSQHFAHKKQHIDNTQETKPH